MASSVTCLDSSSSAATPASGTVLPVTEYRVRGARWPIHLVEQLRDVPSLRVSTSQMRVDALMCWYSEAASCHRLRLQLLEHVSRDPPRLSNTECAGHVTFPA
jgi:hypothetical protein